MDDKRRDDIKKQINDDEKYAKTLQKSESQNEECDPKCPICQELMRDYDAKEQNNHIDNCLEQSNGYGSSGVIDINKFDIDKQQELLREYEEKQFDKDLNDISTNLKVMGLNKQQMIACANTLQKQKHKMPNDKYNEMIQMFDCLGSLNKKNIKTILNNNIQYSPMKINDPKNTINSNDNNSNSIVMKNVPNIETQFKWYWYSDENNNWRLYNNDEQRILDQAWNNKSKVIILPNFRYQQAWNNKSKVIILPNFRYQVEFELDKKHKDRFIKRTGFQTNIEHKTGNKRSVIYAKPDVNEQILGISCLQPFKSRWSSTPKNIRLTKRALYQTNKMVYLEISVDGIKLNKRVEIELFW
eukprot:CAMPEP_0114698016 /NCGR_PEP_ID=MMETSP0191-20121206/74418_1 /TAXON_ID=126664 /ORGANISM="Sorites sp." /LENGTH=355 /DNA_ID=CAMNT_0001997801 /DNA_START=326 /DNA_END=1390 /DNA_ORIENTATION=+